MLLLAGRTVGAAHVTPHDVLAHGDSNQFWIAHIEQTPNVPRSIRTSIYYRLLGEEGKWQLLTPVPLPARVVSLASQNSLPAALLDDGAWVLLYPDAQPFTAGPLPQPARMVALAGGPNTWWAVGVVPGGIAALPGPATTRATSPTTRAAASVQAPQSAPASRPSFSARLVLFSLTGNNWTPRSELPEPVADAPSVSLAFVDDLPYVADLVPGGVRLRHLENKRWATDAELRDLPGLAGFQLLGNSPMPRLWVQPNSGPDQLYIFNKGTSHVNLAPIPGSAPSQRALALATGRLRMVALVQGKLIEQDYNPQTGKAEGPPAQLPVRQSSALDELEWLRWIIVVAALVVAIFGSYRQRAGMKGLAARLDQIAIAPLGRRLAAGLIDAAPIILATAAAVVRFHATQVMPEQSRDLLLLLIYWSAGIFYITYMTVVEALAGRSLGKLLLGLRIIGLDGQPAKPMALIMRNVLRVIEVGLFFLPVLIIALFPLRQRAGDVAAGTLVVMGDGGSVRKQDSGENINLTDDSSKDKP
jgi:uncharacterized RDD family membrane protein YckC